MSDTPPPSKQTWLPLAVGLGIVVLLVLLAACGLSAGCAFLALLFFLLSTCYT